LKKEKKRRKTKKMTTRKRAKDVIAVDDSDEDMASSKTRRVVDRNSDLLEINDDEENETDQKRSRLQNIERESCYEFESAVFEGNAKKVQKFENLSKEAQEQCIKTICRLFVFRGTRKEVITRTALLDALAKIEPEYKSHCDVILERTQERLLNLTGYLIIDGGNIKGCKNGSKTDYYLVNAMDSLALKNILMEDQSNSGQKAVDGFAFVVFHAIFNSPGSSIRMKDLLRNVRKLDSRFPESSLQHTAKSAMTAVPIKELENDFLGLLNHLKKVRVRVMRELFYLLFFSSLSSSSS
jgi:hypothetical protein